MATVGVKGL